MGARGQDSKLHTGPGHGAFRRRGWDYLERAARSGAVPTAHGKLGRDAEIRGRWPYPKVGLDMRLPTRPEELHLVGLTLGEGSGTVLDAGTGFVPRWHVIPELLSSLGWSTVALDIRSDSLDMPTLPNVQRVLGDMTSLSYPDGAYDVVLSVSTVEHIPDADRAMAELFRVARSLVLVTCDDFGVGRDGAWLASCAVRAGWDPGVEMAVVDRGDPSTIEIGPPEVLWQGRCPTVHYLIARRERR